MPCRRVDLVGWPCKRPTSAADGAGAPSRARCDRSACAQGAITIGQKVRTIARDALQNLLKLVEQLFAQGHSCEHILGALLQGGIGWRCPLSRLTASPQRWTTG